MLIIFSYIFRQSYFEKCLFLFPFYLLLFYCGHQRVLYIFWKQVLVKYMCWVFYPSCTLPFNMLNDNIWRAELFTFKSHLLFHFSLCWHFTMLFIWFIIILAFIFIFIIHLKFIIVHRLRKSFSFFFLYGYLNIIISNVVKIFLFPIVLPGCLSQK